MKRVVVIPAEGASFTERKAARHLTDLLNRPENIVHALRVVADREAIARDLALHGCAAFDRSTGQRLVLFPGDG